MPSPGFMLSTKRHPSAILLLIQMLGMVLYPFIENIGAGPVVFNAFGIVVLGVTIHMVRRTPGHTCISASFAGGPLSCCCSCKAPLVGRSYCLGLLHWRQCFILCSGQLDCIHMGDRRASSDELFAAGATFTLIAWAFTHLFVLIQALQPGTYAAAVQAANPRTWTELNYQSFALISSTGIGDVIPLTSHARALASVEMFVGVMYIAAVVARLIGFTVQSQK